MSFEKGVFDYYENLTQIRMHLSQGKKYPQRTLGSKEEAIVTPWSKNAVDLWQEL